MERDQASKLIHDLMRVTYEKGASDLFITCDFPPAIKVDGIVVKLTTKSFEGRQTVAIARALMTDRQAADFERNKECNFAIPAPGIGRFRVNAFFQQGRVGLVLRHITSKVPNIEALGLPEILKNLALVKRGICILVGATGSGKSTTLAAMTDWRNEHSQGHIVTIEDPIEFIHPHRNCIVTQREIGLDTESWSAAIKNALRQAPDVILMGEIRDQDSMEQALSIADTGHLCLATLHANSANEALERIVNFFPEARRKQLLQDLSLNLTGLVSQRLVMREDSRGRALAIEVMLNTPLVSDLIGRGEILEIKELMKKSRPLGMQTFDQSLFDLFENGVISYGEALRYADSQNDLRLQIKVSSSRGMNKDLAAGTEHFTLTD
jgi:twitching motility protein PilU